ncbi:hypothetical protein AX16_010228 [Volvariella volvacea WC 439]|nr:hypothetical protein AX16_010228 [Volvariella volvacea WC 439]
MGFPSIDIEKTALLLIDIQNGFYTNPTYFGTLPRSTPSFESNITALLSAFRQRKCPNIIHVYHSSVHLDSPLHPTNPDGRRFATYAEPVDGELTVEKNVNSAFIGTNLEAVLRERGIELLIVAGLTTNHCVSTSVRMASNLGVAKEIILLSDATAALGKGKWDAETVHGVNLDTLEGEFCVVKTTEDIVRALGQ